jgi:hypothetical protein
LQAATPFGFAAAVAVASSRKSAGSRNVAAATGGAKPTPADQMNLTASLRPTTKKAFDAQIEGYKYNAEHEGGRRNGHFGSSFARACPPCGCRMCPVHMPFPVCAKLTPVRASLASHAPPAQLAALASAPAAAAAVAAAVAAVRPAMLCAPLVTQRSTAQQPMSRTAGASTGSRMECRALRRAS